MTWWIGHFQLIEFLNALAHTNVERSEGPSDAGAQRRVRVGTAKFPHVIDVLKRVARERHGGASVDDKRLRYEAESHLKLLLEKSVLRVGLKVQCSHCSQRNWYSLSDAAEVVRCDRCLQSFSFPVARPLDADWEYRPIGPFAMENYAQGSYAAVLALRFLTYDARHDAVWIPAFEMKRDPIALECDFAAFIRRHIGSHAFDFAVGECKSGDRRFVAKDFRVCRSISETLPGSAFLFVTTRRELDEVERRSVGALARRGWRLIEGRWRTPVVVLTRRELEARNAAPYCWGNATESVVEEYQNDRRSTEMERLARATQRLYLGLKPPTGAQH